MSQNGLNHGGIVGGWSVGRTRAHRKRDFWQRWLLHPLDMNVFPEPFQQVGIPRLLIVGH